MVVCTISRVRTRILVGVTVLVATPLLIVLRGGAPSLPARSDRTQRRFLGAFLFAPGELVERTVLLRVCNLWRRPAHAAIERVSCGCLEAALDRSVVEPGKAARLKSRLPLGTGSPVRIESATVVPSAGGTVPPSPRAVAHVVRRISLTAEGGVPLEVNGCPAGSFPSSCASAIGY